MKLGMQVGLVLDEDRAPPKGAQPQIFGPYPLYSQTAGWIKMTLGMAVALGPATLCEKGTQLPQKRGRSPPQFSAHVCCGKAAGCIRIPLDMEVGLGPGDIVLDGEPAPPKRGTQAPNFRPMSVVAKRLDG